MRRLLLVTVLVSTICGCASPLSLPPDDRLTVDAPYQQHQQPDYAALAWELENAIEDISMESGHQAIPISVAVATTPSELVSHTFANTGPAEATRSSDPRSAHTLALTGRASSTSEAFTVTVDDLISAKEFVREVGSIERAKAALDTFDQFIE